MLSEHIFKQNLSIRTFYDNCCGISLHNPINGNVVVSCRGSLFYKKFLRRLRRPGVADIPATANMQLCKWHFNWLSTFINNVFDT